MPAAERFFVDSNVLLYRVDPVERPKRQRAGIWLDRLWEGGAGRVSWQVLHEFYWNAVKKMGLAPDRGREMVEDLAQWRPVDTSIGLIQQAWHWVDSAQLPYWDALIVAAAERSGAQYLLSEDFQTGRRFGEVRVVNPFDREPSEFRI
jgi:predicted nucleic acid-binding protein